MRAPTVTRGSIAQVSHQAASRTTRARAMLRDEHERDRGELEPVLAPLGMPVQVHDDGDGEVAVEEGCAERDGSGRPADGEHRHAGPVGGDERFRGLPGRR